MEASALVELVAVGVTAGGTCSAVTVAAIKADVRNIRAWLQRVDSRANKAHDKATEAAARVSVVEAKLI